MSHRYITIPKPVDAGAELSFALFVRFLVEADERFNKSAAGARAGMRLDVLEHAAVGDVVKVHPDDWKLLHEAAEQPTAGYPQLTAMRPDGSSTPVPIPARKLLPLIEALSPESTKGEPPTA